MEIHESRRSFRTLDGLRGVAALLVVTRHIGPMGVSLPNTFLAVDLFFLLSGYVVAYAYDRRLAAGGFFGRFFMIRLIRLYPLYIAGLAIGSVAHLGGRMGLTPGLIFEAVIVGVLMIPANPLLRFGSSTLNGPAWTLPLELFANLIYAAMFPLLRKPILIGVVVAGAVGILASAHFRGQLDLGWAFEDLPVAMSRLGFSFFAGVLMFRVSRRGSQVTVRPFFAWGCLVSLGVLLLVRPPTAMSLIYQEVLILVAFPAIVWVATVCEPDQRSGKLFRFIGVISYAVYTTHQPLGLITVRVLAHFAHPDWHVIHSFTAVIFIAALVPICWAIDEFYDAPVRGWLGRKLLQQR